ncbi:MAG: peptidoglycan editing factor PgeF [Bacillota bacterium]
MFKLVAQDSVQYYIIEEFCDLDMVDHAYSTRVGGVSQGGLAELNLGFDPADQREHVVENRRRICQILGIDHRKLVAQEQTHSDNIEIVTKDDCGRGALTKQTEIKNTDALITNQRQVPLMAFGADCVPLLMLDPQQEVIAVCHGGWRGTVKKIAQQTVQQMRDEFAVQPKNLLVGIGPSIGPCCYEVDEQVIKPLQQAFIDWQDLVTAKGAGKWQLNLWQANSQQLQELGVLKENIIISGACTACNPNYLYSYRAADDKTGRLATLIQLK